MSLERQSDAPQERFPRYGELGPEENRGTSLGVWVALLALAIAIFGCAYYGYPALREQSAQIRQLLGSQTSLIRVGQRMDTFEGKMHELSGSWEGFGKRVTKLEALQGKIQTNLEQTRKYAETLTQQLHQQLTAEMEAHTSALDTRLRDVESEQAAQRSQLTQVESELKQEFAAAQVETHQDLSGVHQQIEANARDLNNLTDRLGRERVDFELSKDQTKELVPGITLRITGTNPTYQNYRGTLWLLQDRRTLWLRNEDVHRPVRFFHKDGGEPYELVITDVTEKSATGYLLVPANQETGYVADQQGAQVEEPSRP